MKREYSKIGIISLVFFCLLIILELIIRINNKIIKKQNMEYTNYLEKIDSGVINFINQNKVYKEKLNDNYVFVLVSVKELIDNKYIENNLINPKTKEHINDKGYLKITKDKYNNYDYSYVNSKETNKLYLSDLVLKISNIKNIKDYYNTQKIAYIDENGLIIDNYLNDNNLILNTKLDDISSIGNYELIYTFENTEYKQNLIIVDDIAPRIENIEYPKEKWQKDVTVWADVYDTDSSIDSFSISTNCQSFKNNISSKISGVIDKNGIYYICVKDTSGNLSKTKIVIDNIDEIEPIININPFNEIDNILSGTIIDNESGIVAYAITTSENTPNNWTIIENTKQYEFSYQIAKKSSYYIWAKDKIGNIKHTKPIDLNTITIN